jgi:uncharacterized protein YjbI with pentapeptide repeats
MLYDMASYLSQQLQGVVLSANDLSGWNFAGQNLTGASFYSTAITGTDFSGAIVRGVHFGDCLTAAQLYSTASYQAHDLRNMYFNFVDMSGWNMDGQDLSGAHMGALMTGTSFRGASLINAGMFWSGDYNMSQADLTGADTRGAAVPITDQVITSNLIWPDGTIRALNLTTENHLLVRDHDGRESEYDPIAPLPIHIEDGISLNSTSALELRFDADEWNSTISFETGIPVALDGTLELTFADDVNITSQIGRTLDLFDWTGVSPTGLLTVGGPYTWDLTNLYTTGEVTLVGVEALPGDFDGDGDVDGRDFLMLQRDSELWSLTARQANYGDSVSGMGAFVPVPEPGGWVMVIILGLCTVCGGRPRTTAR